MSFLFIIVVLVFGFLLGNASLTQTFFYNAGIKTDLESIFENFFISYDPPHCSGIPNCQ